MNLIEVDLGMESMEDGATIGNREMMIKKEGRYVHMNLQQLKIFVLTVKYKKLTLVAEELGVKQPNVTFHLNRLQEEWGVPLFQAHNHRIIKLTEAGQTLFHYAQQITSLDKELHTIMGDFRQLKKGRLSLGSTFTPATYILPTYLGAFKKKYPDIQLSLDVKTAPIIIEQIKNYELDFGLISYDNIIDPELEVTSLRKDDLILVIHKSHPLACKSEIKIKDLEGIPFILHEQGSVSRRLILEWANKNNLQLEETMEVSATETMKEAVRQNIGVAIMSELNAKRDIEVGNLVGFPLPQLSFKRVIYLIYRKNRLLTPPMQNFLEETIGKLKN